MTSQGKFDYIIFDNLGVYLVKYEGDFLDNNNKSIDTLNLNNGDVFTGEFHNDLVHGKGKYIPVEC